MTPLRLMIEASVVGIVNVLLFFIVHLVAMRLVGDEAMTNHLYLSVQLLITGILFHTLFEVTGLNTWYCNNRE